MCRPVLDAEHFLGRHAGRPLQKDLKLQRFCRDTRPRVSADAPGGASLHAPSKQSAKLEFAALNQQKKRLAKKQTAQSGN